MTTPITIESTTGAAEQAALALPPGEGRAGTIIVVHEWWGLNDDIRALCDRFAAEGYIALGVDLYGGRSTSDGAEAMQLSNDMKTAEAMKVVEGAARFLTAHPRSNGRLAITGFCLGGGIALAGACTVPGITCAVPFYGLPRPEFLRFDASTPAILGHYAEVDAFVTPERVRAVHESALAAGAHFDLSFYPAGHAFMRKGDPSAYDEPAATLAWSRTIAFLKREIAG